MQILTHAKNEKQGQPVICVRRCFFTISSEVIALIVVSILLLLLIVYQQISFNNERRRWSHERGQLLNRVLVSKGQEEIELVDPAEEIETGDSEPVDLSDEEEYNREIEMRKAGVWNDDR